MGRVFTGWLALVVLYTVLTESDRLSEGLGIGNSALAALSDPSRPLIRDHTQPAPKTTPAPTGWHVGMDPSQNQAHPGTQTPSPVAPGAPEPPTLPSFLTQH
jgi:hypothetical protein